VKGSRLQSLKYQSAWRPCKAEKKLNQGGKKVMEAKKTAKEAIRPLLSQQPLAERENRAA
jgi:hypothetical protein